MSSFSDPKAVAHYVDGPVRQVPGFHALQRMALLLLEERVPVDGDVLVLGAGGGLELRVFADAHPDWHMLGVDPSEPMLALARETLGTAGGCVELLKGYIGDTPHKRFDGATCLLTLHFLPADERLQTLRELRARLKPGAPLIVAHHSFPQYGDAKRRWLRRYAAFGVSSGLAPEDAARAIDAVGSRLPLLSPDEDEALMREAGFEEVELFYAALSFRGWVASAPAA